MSKNINFVYLFDFYKDMLTEKQAAAIDLYYNEDLSLGEISDQLGITRQGVRDNIKRAEQVMLNLEEKIGAASRYSSTFASLEDTVEMLDSVRQMAAEEGHKRIEDECLKIINRIEGVINGI
ncbi:MAG: sigma factor-like helix-turn-helix DNA-binding protein [Eubacteriales bacterium]|nr:sigma factor-like helix-turn-helix DNA-binding protein [Eubacteriales bacterium]